MVKSDVVADLKFLRLLVIANNLALRVREVEQSKLCYLEFVVALLVQDYLAYREVNWRRCAYDL